MVCTYLLTTGGAEEEYISSETLWDKTDFLLFRNFSLRSIHSASHHPVLLLLLAALKLGNS